MIFDFDGVLVDSEPIHLQAFRAVLAEEGVELTDAMYYERYLGYDDRDCFRAVARDCDRAWDMAQIDELTSRKTVIVQRMLREGLRALPGAVEMVRAAESAGVPIAICSGALGAEVRLACKVIGVADRIPVVVAAEDVDRGKPDPEGYLKAARLLGERHGREVQPSRCVVCEDSPTGIAAGKAAGMVVLGLATSYEPDELSQADHVVENLAAITLDELIRLGTGKNRFRV